MIKNHEIRIEIDEYLPSENGMLPMFFREELATADLGDKAVELSVVVGKATLLVSVKEGGSVRHFAVPPKNLIGAVIGLLEEEPVTPPDA